MSDHVVLVSRSGQAIGTCEKLQAHIEGRLHRAFSLMIARKTADSFEVLLQKRASDKYHSGAKWSNTCCSHPRPGEDIRAAVQRRVDEELGVRETLNLVELQSVVYRAELDNGLIENEFDHVFVCLLEDVLTQPNPHEVSNVDWVDIRTVSHLLTLAPEQFTAWFSSVHQEVCQYLLDFDNLNAKYAS